MTVGHTERMLMADLDPQAALRYRSVAEEKVKLHERAAELHAAVGDEVPAATVGLLDTARVELKEFNRVCLRHAAHRLDIALQAEGEDSEWESAVIMFDLQNPVAV